MDSNLEYKLKLKTKSEVDSISPWFIDEIDEKGKVIGEDLVPWDWGFNFHTKKIVYQQDYQFTNEDLESSFFDEKGVDTKKKSKNTFNVVDTENISGQLIPDDKNIEFSMFGTNREIKEFHFSIYPSDHERCDFGGYPEYTSEIDSRRRTEPDSVWISIYLKESKFRKLTELISSKSLTSFSVHIRGVEGFYSHWSPSITTNLVKVLTKEHKVDIPKDCKIKPPRTGQIRELGLYPGSSQEFVINQDLGIDGNDEEDETYLDDELVEETTKEVYLQEKLSKQISSLEKVVNKFYPLVNVILVVLFLILLLISID